MTTQRHPQIIWTIELDPPRVTRTLLSSIGEPFNVVSFFPDSVRVLTAPWNMKKRLCFELLRYFHVHCPQSRSMAGPSWSMACDRSIEFLFCLPLGGKIITHPNIYWGTRHHGAPNYVRNQEQSCRRGRVLLYSYSWLLNLSNPVV